MNDFLSFATNNLKNFIIQNSNFTLGEEILGSGKIGVVFKAKRKLTELSSTVVAIKVIPQEKLRSNWDDEIVKLSKLNPTVKVPHYINHGTFHAANEMLAYIVYDYIPSTNLRDWLSKNRATIAFVEGLILEILEVFHAMQVVGIQHNDLHSGNILVTHDEQNIESELDHFFVTDFGIGGSANDLPPKNDNLGLAEIINQTLEKVDFSELSQRDKEKYELIKSFRKDVSELNPTVASSPSQLRKALKNLLNKAENRITLNDSKLSDPFEYLSCEQIGNSFTLLSRLYSRDFLGRNDLLERNNTIFTGPRGCGKTTVFRNLSAEVSLMTGSDQNNDFIGIYYQCMDLFFAFPSLYLKGDLSEKGLRITAGYFNLALLSEILKYLSVLRSTTKHPFSKDELNGTLADLNNIVSASTIPIAFQSEPLDAWLTWIEMQKRFIRRKRLFTEDEEEHEGYEELDFIKNVCSILQKRSKYFSQRPIFFFIDDYSTPKIPENLQKSIHRIIFQRNAECFFKVSTESITSIASKDATEKVLELSREYDVIDLGSHFLNSEFPTRMKFIADIVNNRLNLCDAISYKEVSQILGSNPIPDTELTREIRKSRSNKGNKQRVKYHGIETFVDLCSGEIGLMLQMLKEMFALANKKGIGSGKIEFDSLPIDKKIQDKAIREMGNSFLVRIESAPQTGTRMREVVVAFAEVSSLALMQHSSKNLATNPPKLATKIELRETPQFESPNDSLRLIYDDLIKYSVFLRDVRGKSIRGAVVPRLFLRRLLIPTFHLTFSKRDNIGLETSEFYLMLSNPKEFVKQMTKKLKKRKGSDQPTFFTSE